MVDARPVVFVMQHPAQHFSPGFRELDRRGVCRSQVLYEASQAGGHEDPGFDAKVRWDVDLLAGYEWSAPEGRGCIRLAHHVHRALRSSKPALVVCFGWGTRISRITLVVSSLLRVPLVVYGDSSFQHGNRRAHRSGLRSFFLRLCLGLARGAVASGTFNEYFYRLHGMPRARIVRGAYPHPYDGVAPSPPSKGAFVIGYVGKLTARKGVEDLLLAASLLENSDDWRIRIVGSGPLEGELRLLSEDLQLTGRVDFAGFVNQSSIPATIQSMSAVVVPSTRDFRTLAVAEAMSLGVPVVVSSGTAVWGFGDLVRPGARGTVLYPSGDVLRMAEALETLMAARGSSPATSHALRARAQDVASTEAFAIGVERALGAFGSGL